MLRSLKSLENYSLSALDGPIGHFKTFHFDDRTWDIRYMVVDTGNFLPGKKVLLMPACAEELSWVKQNIAIKLTKKQIEESAPYDSDLPVSKQHQIMDRKNFEAICITEPWSGSVFPLWFPEFRENVDLILEFGDPHLRCCKVVMNYKIKALKPGTDKYENTTGWIDDFIIDTETWKIKSIIVDANEWLPGGKVIVSIDSVANINCEDKTVSFKLSKEEIEKSPLYDSHEAINKVYEIEYYDYEGRKQIPSV
jgi:hypothetical protein